MRTLSPLQLVGVWERSLAEQPIDRALTILAAACPEMTREELATLPIGLRDSQLLVLREEIFGHTLNSYAECQNCTACLEFPLETSALRVNRETAEDTPLQIVADGFSLTARVPNSFDLAAIAPSSSQQAAYRQLIDRCVLEASRDGLHVKTADLPAGVIESLASQLADRDPQADVIVDLNCSACGHHGSVIFDIASFLWLEINALAKRLLREVHVLARAYGWREADILALSGARRQAYLEMVSG
jgi:hypothetical protein